jgi:hypothetical protein
MALPFVDVRGRSQPVHFYLFFARNEAKLKDVLDAYELTSDLCCSHLNKAWEQR